MTPGSAALLSALQREGRHVLELHADLQPVDLQVAVQLASAAGVSLDRVASLVLDLAVEAFANLELPGPDGRRRLTIHNDSNTR